ncbi:uncharacterized protein [Amphiura filiformis]|uniref:uncharacterized protein n=1 Tax=Amphiura filiformis TaxID=82378 RepID=UPI003B20BACE
MPLQTVSQLTCETISQTANQSGGKSISHSISRSVKHSQSINQSINSQSVSPELLKRTTEIQGWWVSQADHTTDGSLLYARGKQERVTIEAGVDIHTRNLGNAKPKETSRWECDLHLVDQDNQPLPPTARGKYLKIQYAILVEVSVSRANDLTTVIPLPYVLPQANREWEEWEPAEWMKKCTLHRAHEKIAVRNSTLESPVYEELP